MTIDEAIIEWQLKTRRMGCVATANWFCKRVKGFKPERINRYTKSGEVFQHVVAAMGTIRIDLASYNDGASNEA